MFYWLIKPFVFTFFRVFYKYDYKGIENIPYDQPVVLAPNHVNAFIDPIALALLSQKKVRFFARGDVFKGKIARTILNALSISPMYRIQEGYAEIKKNDKTFEECRQRLSANEIILLFPEAICVQERRLRPLKKGLARVVFQTEETLDFSKDVLVIPVGLNYTAAYKFRSKLFIDIGKPISVKEYEARFKEDKVKAINEFTKMLEYKMQQQMVVLNNTDNDELFVSIEEIYMYQCLKDKNQGVTNLQHSYEGSKQLAQMINHYDENNPELTKSLRDHTAEYIRRVRANGLRDHLLRADSIEKNNIWRFIGDYLLIYLGMPLYAIALLLNYPPYFAAKEFSDAKIKNIEFYASVYANLAMILWGIYYALQVLTVALIFRNWILLGAYTLIVPLFGYFCLWYYPVKEKIFGRWRLFRMVRKEKHIVQELIAERNTVILEIEAAMKGYFGSL